MNLRKTLIIAGFCSLFAGAVTGGYNLSQPEEKHAVEQNIVGKNAGVSNAARSQKDPSGSLSLIFLAVGGGALIGSRFIKKPKSGYIHHGTIRPRQFQP